MSAMTLARSVCFNTCSSCEEQLRRREKQGETDVSIHAPLARSNKDEFANIKNISAFQYMLLLRGATGEGWGEGAFYAVSIHAPLARSNLKQHVNIDPRTVSIHAPLARSNRALGCLQTTQSVSIHAPLARSNIKPLPDAFRIAVSIHAPLARSNSPDDSQGSPSAGFNTCSSCEEQLLPILEKKHGTVVSIHAPLARSNLRDIMIISRLSRFNTCSSCEEQPSRAGRI